MDRRGTEEARPYLEAAGIRGWENFTTREPLLRGSGSLSRSGMNWANRLTVSRLGLTILFVVALNSDWRFGHTTALILFAIAGVTDYLDGEIARRYGYVTNFGKLMDPLVDKVLIAAAFISLVPLKAVPAWAATIIVARDFLITGLRLLASSNAQVLPAERLGKHKTSWQIITVIYFLLLLSLQELRYSDRASDWWSAAWDIGGPVLVWTTVALTLYSGLAYAWKHRAVVATER
jgi:CDP-diacylglycerol--glycerol-3-phosphate 3-phosphatidyltransferase